MPEPSIEIHVERPSRPTIWLDTHVLINIARARQGKTAESRATAIGDAVAAMVGSQRLLCIEAEQRAEMRDSRLVQQTLDRLSMGACMRPFREVQHRQLVAGLAAQLAGASLVALPRSMFYDHDPADEVDAALHRGWVLTTHVPTIAELRELRKTTKTTLHKSLEQLRQENRKAKTSFVDQLEKEYGGRLNAISVSVREMQDKLKGRLEPETLFGLGGDRTLDRGLAAMRLITDLRTSTGATPEEVRRFLESSSLYRRALPCEDVHCRLFARLVTQPGSVKGSDANDLDHMAQVVPAVSIIVTDVVLADAVRRLGLDRKYRCKIFSLRETDELLRVLGEL